ncbi:MAG TPA: hypothetical protein PKD78_06580, partial [Saprospiraceae bacterium]|nr:hypothetical protein [Saprospiraceae bacterium]
GRKGGVRAKKWLKHGTKSRSQNLTELFGQNTKQLQILAKTAAHHLLYGWIHFFLKTKNDCKGWCSIRVEGRPRYIWPHDAPPITSADELLGRPAGGTAPIV